MRTLRSFVFIGISFAWLGISFSPAFPDYYQGSRTISINPITPLHKQTQEAIYALRKANINDHKILGIFPKDYAPDATIYGRIDEKADWVNDTQFFVNNPYLLVVISSEKTVNALLPFCKLSSVSYSPGKITETYQGKFAQKWFSTLYDYYSGIIRLWFVNAYDAGFDCAQIDSSKSLNIDFTYPQVEGSVVKTIYSGHEFYHVGHLQKNNISPYDAKATLKLQKRDSKTVIYVKLWENRPSASNVKEDFAYVFVIEP